MTDCICMSTQRVTREWEKHQNNKALVFFHITCLEDEIQLQMDRSKSVFAAKENDRCFTDYLYYPLAHYKRLFPTTSWGNLIQYSI